ncbi:MAG: CDP-diacylglycerol--glycerol-3-phosphate 3-phosphatidyltransferase [Verrucomicrobiales bacterium]
MTLANLITIGRLLSIPVFIYLAVRYSDSLAAGSPEPIFRWSAVILFGLAAVSDFFDGYLARKTGKISRLGAALDPIADKFLITGALVTLSVIDWGQQFPLWFMWLNIVRDLAMLLCWSTMLVVLGKADLSPCWPGKIYTTMMFVCIGWIMFDIPFLPPVIFPVAFSCIFLISSSFLHFLEGFRQSNELGYRHHTKQS